MRLATSYTVNGANELTNSGYAYDGNGNQKSSPTITAFTYTAKEQTTAITPAAVALTASYSGPSQVERTSFAGDAFLNDRLGVGRRTAGATITDYTRNPSGTELSEKVGLDRYYFAFDGLGSVARREQS